MPDWPAWPTTIVSSAHPTPRPAGHDRRSTRGSRSATISTSSLLHSCVPKSTRPHLRLGVELPGRHSLRRRGHRPPREGGVRAGTARLRAACIRDADPDRLLEADATQIRPAVVALASPPPWSSGGRCHVVRAPARHRDPPAGGRGAGERPHRASVPWRATIGGPPSLRSMLSSLRNSSSGRVHLSRMVILAGPFGSGV